jgi:predicted TIM-barrel fold metal-dependent hydrolase
MFHRRDILKAALTAAALPALKLPAYAAPARRFIDIHCHFFNAADLPVRGFLERVVLSDYATGLPQSAAGSPSQAVWKGLAAKLTDLMLKYEAPAAQKELACLKDGSACPGYSAGGPLARSAAVSQKSGLPDPRAGKAIADVLVDHYQARGPQPKSDLPAPRALNGSADTDAFVDFVLGEMEMAGEGAPGASSRSMKSLGSSLSDAAAAVGAYIASGRSIFSRYFAWGELLIGYRETIAETYYSLYDPQNTRIMLTAPCIVDYNYWLQDQTPSPLKDQMELMSALSLRQPRPMHGFMAFDPLREVRRKPDEPSPLAIVQEAVTKLGFLGVKLYSPMGFKPTGNAEQGLGFPAYASMSEPGFGAALDKALDGLYAWCEENEVPIVAHTADSQAAGPGYGARAEPKLWGKVLAKYPALRLDFAHFGFFTNAMSQADASSQFGKTWEGEIAGYIKGGKFPNVYADISYLHWVLEGSASKEHVDAAKKLFAKYFETDPRCERLMFGTDWNMSGRAEGAGQYVDNVEAFFGGLGLKGKQLDNLFYKNALRFTGLGQRGKAEARLRSFYEAAGKPFPAFG